MKLENEEYIKIVKESKIESFVGNFKAYFSTVDDYVVILWNEDGEILDFEERGKKLLGYLPEELKGKKGLDVLFENKGNENMAVLFEKFKNKYVKKYYVGSVRNVNGISKLFLWYTSEFENTQGEKKIFLSIGFNLDSVDEVNSMSSESRSSKFKITKQSLALKRQEAIIKDYKDKLEFLAFYDELTGLPNKNSLIRWLNLELSQISSISTYLVFLEVRNLEKLNIMYGYDLIDELIIHISKRLKDVVGEENRTFKIGFDRFAVICKSKEISNFVEDMLYKLLIPYNVNRNLIKVSFNIGAAQIENANEATTNIIRKCDLALIKAKEKGLNEYEIFRSSLEIQTLKEGILEKELQNGLELNEFIVFYQPIIKLNNDEICGFEALLRWHYLRSVFISPLEFIPVAEKCGLIVDLGNIVLEQSLKIGKMLKKYYNDELIISINISPRQFIDKEFVRNTIEILEENELQGIKLQFEITEKTAIENVDYTIEIINEFERYNVIFALDDFGVDYSSLSYLRKLPVKAIKIDKSFVQDIDNHDTYFIVETIVRLCKKLNLKIVTEGVETQKQYQIMKELGCDYAQGYFIAKPLPVKELIDFVRSNKKLK